MKGLYTNIKQDACRKNTAEYEAAFLKILNKEMEELLKRIESNKELNKLYENISTNSKGVENEKEKNQ